MVGFSADAVEVVIGTGCNNSGHTGSVVNPAAVSDGVHLQSLPAYPSRLSNRSIGFSAVQPKNGQLRPRLHENVWLAIRHAQARFYSLPALIMENPWGQRDEKSTDG